MSKKTSPRLTVRDMATISMCVALIVISSWITVPFAVNFTLQTFAIFVICASFKFSISFASVLLYILMGVCGLPVFSGFGVGISALLGPTGGYIWGFIFIPPIMHLSLRNKRKTAFEVACSMLTGLLLCYILGTLWFFFGYGMRTDVSLFETLCLCVFPFIIPDLLKIILASYVSQRLNAKTMK